MRVLKHSQYINMYLIYILHCIDIYIVYDTYRCLRSVEHLRVTLPTAAPALVWLLDLHEHGEP